MRPTLKLTNAVARNGNLSVAARLVLAATLARNQPPTLDELQGTLGLRRSTIMVAQRELHDRKIVTYQWGTSDSNPTKRRRHRIVRLSANADPSKRFCATLSYHWTNHLRTNPVALLEALIIAGGLLLDPDDAAALLRCSERQYLNARRRRRAMIRSIPADSDDPH